MGKKTLRAVFSPISLVIGEKATRALLQVVAVVAAFVPGGQPIALAAALELAFLYAPTPPKPDATVTSVKTSIPPRVAAYGRSRLYGAYILYTTSSKGVAIDVYAVHETGGVPIDGVERFYLGDQNVATGAGVVTGLADGAYAGASVEIDFRTGHATETAFSQVVTLLPGVWTSSHRGDGVVTAMVTWQAVKSKDYQKRFPNGQPSLSMVARWQRVFDWRDEAQDVGNPATWTWSENAVLHYVHYVLTREKAERAPEEMFPSGAALAAAWARYFEPTAAYWTAAANDADSAVPLKAGGTEPRYRSLVSHKLTDPHKDTKDRLIATFDGWVSPRQDGALVGYSGRYYAPTVDIGPDEITGYSWRDGVEDESAVNQIAVSYVSADHDFNVVETNAWEDAADIATRGGIEASSLSNDVPSWGQGRRLAKRAMARAMAPSRGSVTTNSGGLAVIGQRYINLRLVEAGAVFYSGPAEITSLTHNLATGGVTFNWIAASPAVDAWNPTIEEGNPAPAATTTTSSDLTTPAITAASASFSQDAAANTSGVRVSLTIDAPDREDLTWYVRTRATGATTWDERTYSDLDPGPSVSIITEFVATDASIEVETAYQVGDGRFSDWSATSTVDTSTASLAPDAPAGLSATGFTGSASIDWTNSTSNFSYSRVYRGATSSFGSATLISGDIAGGAGSAQGYTDTVAAGTYYWWVRAYSAAGAASALSGPVTATVS